MKVLAEQFFTYSDLTATRAVLKIATEVTRRRVW